MGLFGAIKGIFGGGGGGGYKSKYTGAYEDDYSDALYNRLGAKQLPRDANGKQQYDMSSVGKAVTPDQATKSYDFSGVNSAMSGFNNPYKFKSSYSGATYNPYQFNFGNDDTINEKANLEYGLGASKINREGKDSLAKIQENVGVRRPGLLLKASENSQRDVAENLAKLNAQLRAEALGQKLSLGKDQQLAQAGEDFRGTEFGANEGYKQFQSLFDREGRQADENYRNSQSLADTNLQDISTKASITQQERDYQDRALEYLMDLFKTTSGLNNQAASMSNQKSGDALKTISSLAGAAAAFI